MNDLEKDMIKQLVDNRALMAVVGKCFDLRINQSKPVIEPTDTNELVGQKYRAYTEAKALVGECFSELLSYQTQEPIKEDFNKGR